MRVSFRELEEYADQMSLELQIPVRVYTAYNTYKLVHMLERGGYRTWSPVFDKKLELWYWMDAFMQGFMFRKKRGEGVLDWEPGT